MSIRLQQARQLKVLRRVAFRCVAAADRCECGLFAVDFGGDIVKQRQRGCLQDFPRQSGTRRRHYAVTDHTDFSTGNNS